MALALDPLITQKDLVPKRLGQVLLLIITSERPEGVYRKGRIPFSQGCGIRVLRGNCTDWQVPIIDSEKKDA